MNPSTAVSRPAAKKKLSNYRVDSTAPNATPSNTALDVDSEVADAGGPLVEVQTEIPIHANSEPKTLNLADASRSLALSLLNSLVFATFVTQVGLLGITASAWFVIGSAIGHGIGFLTMLQMVRN